MVVGQHPYLPQHEALFNSVISAYPWIQVQVNKNRAFHVAVFLLVFIGYFSSKVITSFDSVWVIHTAMSIIREGNTNLDEYRTLVDQIGPEHPEATENIDGHIYMSFPIGTSLMIVPILFVIDRFEAWVLSSDLNATLQQSLPQDIELFIACLIVALTEVVIFQISRLFLGPVHSFLIIFVFAFCTSAWSTASRALWQHGPSMLMLSIALYLLLLARRHPSLIQFVGIPLAFSYVVRPTNSISIVLISVYVLIQYRSFFIRYLLLSSLVVVPFLWFNFSIYHAPLSPYYLPQRIGSNVNFGEALVGNLVSPGRGLFVLSPILLLSINGFILKLRQRLDKLDFILLCCILLHWIAISLFPHWWGGWSFGPRFFTDMMPYFIYFLIPVATAFSQLHGKSKAILGIYAAGLIVFSFFVNDRGANIEATTLWNRDPVNVDAQPARVWDWKDLQFLRGIKWYTHSDRTDLSTSGIPIEQLDLAAYTVIGTNDIRVRQFNADTSLIAAPGPSWILLNSQQSIAPELANLFDGAQPELRAQTLLKHKPFYLYYFDLAQRIAVEVQRTEQVVTLSPDTFPQSASSRVVKLPAHFGQDAELLGFKIITDSSASRITVVSFWQAGPQTNDSTQLFVHAIGSNGQVLA